MHLWWVTRTGQSCGVLAVLCSAALCGCAVCAVLVCWLMMQIVIFATLEVYSDETFPPRSLRPTQQQLLYNASCMCTAPCPHTMLPAT